MRDDPRKYDYSHIIDDAPGIAQNATYYAAEYAKQDSFKQLAQVLSATLDVTDEDVLLPDRRAHEPMGTVLPLGTTLKKESIDTTDRLRKHIGTKPLTWLGLYSRLIDDTGSDGYDDFTEVQK